MQLVGWALSLFLAFKSFPIDFDSTVCGVWVGMLEPVGVEIYDQQVTMLRFCVVTNAHPKNSRKFLLTQ